MTTWTRDPTIRPAGADAAGVSPAYHIVRHENVNVYTRGIVGVATLVGLVALGACGGDEPAPAATGAPAATPAAPEARAQLAALAAAAKDRKLTALYTWSASDRPDRAVVLTSAADGSWRVDASQAALGGTADVSVAQNRDGLFQCALASADRPIQPTCVRVADPDGRIDAGIDPRVQHLFTDWRAVLTDRTAPLSVSTAKPLPGVGGACFSVDSTTASVGSPLDAGIYCYDADGTLTGAKVSFGTLVLSGTPSAPPAAITLPGPVVAEQPLGMAAPPTPSPSTSPSA
ncbi:hypothetical protein [Phytohabitans rumicis]|uniref:Lipoprotein n=1 Tax=Phytohabitans rumicis TaxID=1076125 RepID=A0A6V8L5F4_9ACTN|nr:hypothetical protein [Phytohabitans rumicis]GFJ90800.1 hypothetical protein Prum_044420 [Phytohabitans rumicis]